MATLSEWAAEQQVFAAWLEAAGVVIAALLALAIWALQAWRLHRRERERERRFVETARALGHEARRLAYDGMQASAGGGATFGADIAAQAHQLGIALLALPLEQAPDAALVAPILQLRRHVDDIARLAAEGDGGAPTAQAQAFALLQRGVDLEIGRLDSVERQAAGRPQLSLRHRTEAGMPTTTIDQYSTFRFNDALYPEADGVDFEAIVNNQSVLCTIPYSELNRLAAASGIPGQHHRGAFEQYREAIQRAAEQLIREGAKAPVVVRFEETDERPLQPAALPMHSSV